MKRRTAASIALLLVVSLLLSGCLFGGQNDPVPYGTQDEPTKAAEADTSTAGTDEAAVPETAAASSEASLAPQTAAPSSENSWGPETTASPTRESSQSGGPVGPSAAETNDQIMTVTVPETISEAYRILSRINWADTVWADNSDLCHLRITDLRENSISFYWHTRSLSYPNSFQSDLCTAAFDGESVSCNYTDDQGNSGLVRLAIKDQSISFTQTIVHSGNYSPSDLSFTLLPKTSGTSAIYFTGSWKDASTARRNMVKRSSYYGKVSTCIEQVLGITDVSACSEELLETDTRFYTESELSGFDKDLIKIFKNEIYARHGYQFATAEIYAMFMEFTWYYPDFTPNTFKESVFNKYEKENLKLLVKLEDK